MTSTPPRVHVIDESTPGRTLNDVMEIDHVIEVHADGTVTDGPTGVHAPNLLDDQLDSAAWRLWSHGYSGQDRYSGPVMHDSESIGAGLARDILAEPGVYAAVVAYWSPEPADIPADFEVTPLDDDDPAESRATCGACGRSWDDAVPTSYTPTPSARCPFEAWHAEDEETTTEGWAVVKLADPAPDPDRETCGECGEDISGKTGCPVTHTERELTDRGRIRPGDVQAEPYASEDVEYRDGEGNPA